MTVIGTRGAHLDVDLARRVRHVVLSSGMSQREFADSIGLDPTALSKALAGARRLSDQELASIAALGNVSKRYLLHGTGRPPSQGSLEEIDQNGAVVPGTQTPMTRFDPAQATICVPLGPGQTPRRPDRHAAGDESRWPGGAGARPAGTC